MACHIEKIVAKTLADLKQGPNDDGPDSTSVLFELIGARYERHSMLITANQPFGDWNKVFPDHAMLIAAIDRLVHHSIIFEMNVESYRRRGALERKNRPLGAPSKKAKEAAPA